MAKIKLNAALQQVSGSLGKVVFKQYGDRTYLSPMPDMSRVKPSTDQTRQRERMKWCPYFYRDILRHPNLRAQYAALAAGSGMSLYNYITKDYMRRVASPEAKLRLDAAPPLAASGRGQTVNSPQPTLPPKPQADAWCW